MSKRPRHMSYSVPLVKVRAGTSLVRTHVHFTPETHNAVRELAFKHQMSFAGMLELLVVEALKKRGIDIQPHEGRRANSQDELP